MMELEQLSKKCTKCGETKPLTEFSFRRDKEIHISRCKVCIREYSKDHYRNNREKYLERQKKYRLENPDEYKKRQQESYLRNREKRLKKFKEYRDKDPKKYNDVKRIYNFLHGRSKSSRHSKGYLDGDGCCLCCFEPMPKILDNHHPWGYKNPLLKGEWKDFTISLCKNCHELADHWPSILESWGNKTF